MHSKRNNFQDASDTEIATSRVLNIDIERLYQAWTTPELIAQWWGPRGFSSTFHNYDLRPGGQWNFIMHGPDGADYKNTCEFLEVIPFKKLVWKHISTPVFYVIVTFDHLGPRTKCTFRMSFENKQQCDQIKSYAMEANEENFDKLEEILNLKENLKEKATRFLELTASGKIDEAYEKYIGDNFRHHNLYFKGDRESLRVAMHESHKIFPETKIEVQKVLQENDTVTTFSIVHMKPGDAGVALVHAFRFEQGMVREMWDLGVPLPENIINENGVF